MDKCYCCNKERPQEEMYGSFISIKLDPYAYVCKECEGIYHKWHMSNQNKYFTEHKYNDGE